MTTQEMKIKADLIEKELAIGAKYLENTQVLLASLMEGCDMLKAAVLEHQKAFDKFRDDHLRNIEGWRCLMEIIASREIEAGEKELLPRLNSSDK